MRIEVPSDSERLGAVVIHDVQRVYELDSGLGLDSSRRHDQGAVIQTIPYEMSYDIEKQMAVVVPMRGERIKLVNGVLRGIPNHCLTIIASNSARDPVDRFAIEQVAFEQFAQITQKNLIIVHQKDPALAAAFRNAGYPYIIDEKTGLIKSGKAEGMILATVLSRLSGQRYLGFIDADNYFPGAVLEYIREYAAGFAMAGSAYAMVRISWHSKPKVIEDSLFFAKWGRVSRSTNHYLNMLIGEYTGFETDIIKTGNAGEHALSMDLAMRIDYSSGYSIEPYHYISLLEKFGGLMEGTELAQEMIRKHIEIFQIESLNPHMHDTQKGEEHIAEMSYAAMQVIYRSPICPPRVKERLLERMESMNIPKKNKKLTDIDYYPALHNLDLDAFMETIADQPYAASLREAQEQ